MTTTKHGRHGPGKGRHVVVAAGVALSALIAATPPAGTGIATGAVLAVWMLLATWIAAIDITHHRIPNPHVAAMTLTALAGLSTISVFGEQPQPSSQLPAAVAQATIASLIALTIHIATRGSLGMGDVKLLFPLTLGLAPFGTQTIWTALTLTAATAGLTAGHHLLRGHPSQPIPLAPHLMIGAGLTLLRI